MRAQRGRGQAWVGRPATFKAAPVVRLWRSRHCLLFDISVVIQLGTQSTIVPIEQPCFRQNGDTIVRPFAVPLLTDSDRLSLNQKPDRPDKWLQQGKSVSAFLRAGIELETHRSFDMPYVRRVHRKETTSSAVRFPLRYPDSALTGLYNDPQKLDHRLRCFFDTILETCGGI